jgi:glycosyltransferase involved in cell wall biosynthesis
MRNHLISVVLPCHGSLPYIQETVESLVNQSFSDFEVLVVNDRISDLYIDQIRNLTKHDTRFRVIESNGRGISAALNTGIAHSNASLIARIDADDIMDSMRLKMQFREISTNEQILCVGSQLKIIDMDGNLTRYTNFPESFDEIRQMMQLRNVIAHPSVLFRKSAVLQAGSYRSFFDGAEDYDLWLRLLNLGEIVNLNQPLTSYRVHPFQETRKNREIQQEMDSFTRFCSFATLHSPIFEGFSDLKSLVNQEAFRSVDVIRVSGLPHRARVSLLCAGILNSAMSNPGFVNSVRSLLVLIRRPHLFFLAIKYVVTR